jgi:hypothetical protein
MGTTSAQQSGVDAPYLARFSGTATTVSRSPSSQPHITLLHIDGLSTIALLNHTFHALQKCPGLEWLMYSCWPDSNYFAVAFSSSPVISGVIGTCQLCYVTTTYTLKELIWPEL